MLHLTPFRYLLSSLLNVTLHDQPIRESILRRTTFPMLIGALFIECTNKEYVTFDPPPGQTCAAYMQVRLTTHGTSKPQVAYRSPR